MKSFTIRGLLLSKDLLTKEMALSLLEFGTVAIQPAEVDAVTVGVTATGGRNRERVFATMRQLGFVALKTVTLP